MLQLSCVLGLMSHLTHDQSFQRRYDSIKALKEGG